MTETKLLYFLWYSQTYGADTNGSWRRDIGGTEPKQQTKIEGFFCGRSSPSQVFFVCPWRHFTRIHHQQRLFPYSTFIRSTTRFAGACNPFFTSTRHFSPSFLKIHFVANLLVPETKAFYNSLSIPHSLFCSLCVACIYCLLSRQLINNLQNKALCDGRTPFLIPSLVPPPRCCHFDSFFFLASVLLLSSSFIIIVMSNSNNKNKKGG